MGFIGAKDDGGGGDNWSYKSWKAPVKLRQQQTNIKFVTGRMPFLSPNQQCQSTEEKRDAEIHVSKDSAAEQQRIALYEAPH